MQEHGTTKPMIMILENFQVELQVRNGGPEIIFIFQCPSTFCCMGTNKTSMRAYCIPACLWAILQRKINCQFNPIQSIKAINQTEAVLHYQHICNTSTITV